MAEGNRPVTRIPSIFDSEDDSDDEPPSPMTFRAMAPTTVNDSNGEPPPSKPPVVSASSDFDDSEEEAVPMKPEVSAPTSTEKRLTVTPSRDYLSSDEDSDCSEEETEDKILQLTDQGTGDRFGDGVDDDDDDDDDDEDDGDDDDEDEDEDDGGDDMNISHSSHENLEGSEDDDDDDEDDDEDDEDEDEDNNIDDDDELNKSGSSLDYDEEESDSKDGAEVDRYPFPIHGEDMIDANKKKYHLDTEAKKGFVLDDNDDDDDDESMNSEGNDNNDILDEASKDSLEDGIDSENENEKDISIEKDLNMGNCENEKVEDCKKVDDWKKEQPQAMEEDKFKGNKEGDGEKPFDKSEENEEDTNKDNDSSKSNFEAVGSARKDKVTKVNDRDEERKSFGRGERKDLETLEKEENKGRGERKDFQTLEKEENKSTEFLVKRENNELLVKRENNELLVKRENNDSDATDGRKNEDKKMSNKGEDQESGAIEKEENGSVSLKEKTVYTEAEEKEESQNVEGKDKREDRDAEVVEGENKGNVTGEENDRNTEVIRRGKASNKDEEKDVKLLEKDHHHMSERDMKMLGKDPSMNVLVNEIDTDTIESESRDTLTPKRMEEPCCTDSDTENTMDNEKGALDDELSTSVKMGPAAAAAGRTSGRVPVRVEDVYTDSEDEDSHEPAKSKDKSTSDIVASSETDSVDPEDQKDCISLPGSSRASSLEPGQNSHDLGVKAPLSKGSPSTPGQKSQTQQLQGSSVIRNPRPKRSSKSSVNLDECMKAFKKGWKREIVFRATVDPNKGGARADIYYYAPNGKKLRSKVEIEDHLSRNSITDISLEHFTWIKEPLGVSKEYEQIRHASKYVKTSTTNVTPPPTIVPKPAPEVPAEIEVQIPRKRGRGRPPKNPGEQPVKRARMKITPIVPLSLKKERESNLGTKSVSPQTSVSIRALGVQKTLPLTSPVTPSTAIRSPVNKNWKPAITLESPITVSSSISEKPVQPALVKTDVTANKTPKNHIVYTTKICNEPTVSPRILTPM